jgi:hypothetical protein
MIAAFLLAAAATPSALDAERAFAADAQKLGQWTAFRKYATDDALMFIPQPTNAQTFLKDRKDPPVAVFWWPGRSYVSCDGSTAVNTGPWVREWGKSVGYFTTVWKRQADGGWKWIYDGGDSLPVPRPEGGDIKPDMSSCSGRPHGAKVLGTVKMAGYSSGGGTSPDGTLAWSWTVGPKGARQFLAQQWDGRQFVTVLDQSIAAE